jgi:hypothetical protein
MIRLCRIPILLLSGALLLGCNSSGNSKRFFPSETSARESLEIALNRWKDGQKPGHVDDHKPALEILDSKWEAGQKLTGYEITGEEKNADNHHRFTVKLTLKQGGTVEAHYIVYGQNPLWVCREEDYAKLSGG